MASLGTPTLSIGLVALPIMSRHPVSSRLRPADAPCASSDGCERSCEIRDPEGVLEPGTAASHPYPRNGRPMFRAPVDIRDMRLEPCAASRVCGAVQGFRGSVCETGLPSGGFRTERAGWAFLLIVQHPTCDTLPCSLLRCILADGDCRPESTIGDNAKA